MRALDTLQKASSPIAPSSSQADAQPRTATRTREEKLGFLHTDFGFQPRVNPAVPDYEELYKAFQKQAAKRRDTREATRNKPFLLRTASLCHTRRPCDVATSEGRKVRAQAGGPGLRPKTQEGPSLNGRHFSQHFSILKKKKDTGSAVSRFTAPKHF